MSRFILIKTFSSKFIMSNVIREQFQFLLGEKTTLN